MGEIAIQEDWSLSEINNAVLDPGLSFEDFTSICQRLGGMQATIKRADAEIKFAIGDAIIRGEQTFGARSYQAFEEFGLSEEVLGNCARVSQRVPRSLRRTQDGLSWSHHRAVAALEPPAQKKWLEKAVKQNLGHHALREALRNGVAPAERELCPSCHRPL